MKIVAFIFCVIITLSAYMEQVTARNSFGAHQNVEGIDTGNRQPNVVMQSVVLGKNGNKNSNDEVEYENEIETAVRKLMKLFCPCVSSNKYDTDDEYDCFNGDYADVSIKTLTKILNNKLRGGFISSEESRYNDEPLRRSRNLFKGRRNKYEFTPYRPRSISRFISRYQENEDKSNESLENINRNLNVMRRGRYERRRNAIASSELDVDGEYCTPWSRPDTNTFRPRRKPNANSIGRQRYGENWWPQRSSHAQSCRAPTQSYRAPHAPPIPRDILYIPQFERPTRRKNRFSIAERDWSAE